jgi:hypothetical protein
MPFTDVSLLQRNEKRILPQCGAGRDPETGPVRRAQWQLIAGHGKSLPAAWSRSGFFFNRPVGQ